MTSTQKPALTLTRSGIIGTVIVLLVAAVCIRLGFWQLDRLAQRRDRNAALEERLATPPVAFTGLPPDTAGLLYRRARVEGGFDDERTIVLPGRSYRGSPGVHVLTPLRLGSGGAVLVNRGWVPAADAATIPLDSIRTSAADTTVEGLLLPFPGRGASRGAANADVAADSAFRRVWFALDEELLRRQFPYRLADVQLQLLPTERAAGTLPVRLPPPPLDEGPHRGYAIQWFSFATIAIVGWIALLSRERRQPTRSD